jgi:hypothetical protein
MSDSESNTDRDRVMAAVCERIRKQTDKSIGYGIAFGADLSRFEDNDRVGAAVLKELKAAVPGPWPQEEPRVRCWLDGSVLRMSFTMQPGPVADQLARAGIDVRCADGSPYVPEDEEIVITVREIKRDL